MAYELLVPSRLFGVETIERRSRLQSGPDRLFPSWPAEALPLQIEPPRWRLPAACSRLPRRPRATASGCRLALHAVDAPPPSRALARVAYVRATMRPYALFDEPPECSPHDAVAAIGLTSVALFASARTSSSSPGAPPVCATCPTTGAARMASPESASRSRSTTSATSPSACSTPYASWTGRADRFEIQVLDDSDDDTVAIVAAGSPTGGRRGVDVTHVARGVSRRLQGGRAGAWADADRRAVHRHLRRRLHVPRRTSCAVRWGAFDDPGSDLSQARWGHLDEGYSWFTRLQALPSTSTSWSSRRSGSARGFFTNFTGTAGVWRRAAIEDAGGWSADTLTEDLDLSYRAQLGLARRVSRGSAWFPEELPVSFNAYRRPAVALGHRQLPVRVQAPVPSPSEQRPASTSCRPRCTCWPTWHRR